MFLFQKFKYEAKFIKNIDEAIGARFAFESDKPSIVMFDTETTGLNYMKDTPFLMTFGWGKRVYAVDLLESNAQAILDIVYDIFKKASWVFAHNAKYDYHMMINYGRPLPDSVRIADSQTVSRLTNYADEQFSKSLETMGTMYVDESSKFAASVIKNRMRELNAKRKNEVKEWFKHNYPALKFSEYWEKLKDRIAYVKSEDDEILDDLADQYKEANYLDVYRVHQSLMVNYAYDDIVIMIEWLSKAIPVLKKADPELIVFKREAELIRATAKQERIGFKVDISYLLESRKVVSEYRESLYRELHALIGKEITVGQHAEIAKIFSHKYNVSLVSVDNKSLSRIKKDGEPQIVAGLIRKLRTVDKWLSTYIDGLLNKLVDGRVHTSIDLSGAVSGRVSSDMQQQPKEALKDKDGNELYHPRRAILADDDYTLFFFDYSQQELRVQAYYTLLCSTGDVKLLRAYMPFNCTSILTDEVFDYKNKEVLSRWNSGEWVDEDGELWAPRDVHTETTFTAFPELNRNKNHPEFDHYRKLGKVCNFLKNYQGGVEAIMEQLDVGEDIANKLDRAYYETFPNVREYQRWVVSTLNKQGYIEGLYGRRYYMKNSKWFYKASNYLIQGSCADMVKSVELKVDKLLDGTKSSFVMPIHDEIIVRVHNDELYLVDKIKAIMDDVPEVPWVPMICEVEYTKTNWADKEEM